jgi:hypothetical protein
LLLPSIRRPPLLRRPSGRRHGEGSPAPRWVDMYSCRLLLLACFFLCLGLALFMRFSDGSGGLAALSGDSREPFGPPPRCRVRRGREVRLVSPWVAAPIGDRVGGWWRGTVRRSGSARKSALLLLSMGLSRRFLRCCLQDCRRWWSFGLRCLWGLFVFSGVVSCGGVSHSLPEGGILRC